MVNSSRILRMVGNGDLILKVNMFPLNSNFPGMYIS